MNRLEVKEVCKSFDGKPVLDRVSLTLNQGELVSLLGISGSGKTTLFNVISGLTLPDSGQVLLDGQDITGSPGHMGYMLQKDLLLPFRTVEDNVALPLILKGLGKKQARQEALAYLPQFGLEGTQKLYPHALSGGMRQRAALLRTYLFSGEAILLDEPFSALDALTRRSIHRWYLDTMQKLKLSTVLITHDIDEAILLSDRIYLLSGQPGRVTEEIVIDEKKPRNEGFSLSPAFLEYKKYILSRL